MLRGERSFQLYSPLDQVSVPSYPWTQRVKVALFHRTSYSGAISPPFRFQVSSGATIDLPNPFGTFRTCIARTSFSVVGGTQQHACLLHFFHTPHERATDRACGLAALQSNAHALVKRGRVSDRDGAWTDYHYNRTPAPAQERLA